MNPHVRAQVVPVRRPGRVTLTGRCVAALIAAALMLTIVPATGAVYYTGQTGGGQAHENTQPSLAVNYVIALTGAFPSRTAPAGDEVPSSLGTEPYIGEIGIFAGNFAPRGWAFCDGQLLAISQYSALFSILGTTYGGDGRTTLALPDLRGRAPIHPGSGPGLTPRILGERTGFPTAPVNVNQLPSHNHTLPPGARETFDTGGNQGHANMQPVLGINYILALQGTFPSRNDPTSGAPETTLGAFAALGEVSMFGGNFAPRGWALCDGQLLDISQNTALFSILGTTYGGDGRTTFALPDLRGRVTLHAGQGAGLTDRPLGQRAGAETVALTVGSLPSHSHSVPPLPPWKMRPATPGAAALTQTCSRTRS